MTFPGYGILQGLAVTARNFIGSYLDVRREKRLTTQLYPEERPVLTETYRNVPFLIYDGDDAEAGMRCVACQMCEKSCPPHCIHIETERDAAGKPLRRPAVFNIDIAVCMGCQLCAEVCPFDAIRMDNDYELGAYDRFESLLLTKKRLLKPNAYYHKIHPAGAARTDARRAAEREKKAAAARLAAEKLAAEKAAAAKADQPAV